MSNWSYIKNDGKYGLLMELAFHRHQYQQIWPSGYGDIDVFVSARGAILVKIAKKGRGITREPYVRLLSDLKNQLFYPKINPVNQIWRNLKRVRLDYVFVFLVSWHGMTHSSCEGRLSHCRKFTTYPASSQKTSILNQMKFNCSCLFKHDWRKFVTVALNIPSKNDDWRWWWWWWWWCNVNIKVFSAIFKK